MTTTNKIFLQLLERDIGSNNRGKWTSWTIVTRVIAYYFTYLNVTDFSSFWFLGGSDTGLDIFFSFFFKKKYIILFLLKEKCKECGNTLKQIGDQPRYYCDSSPTRCSMSGKTHNI